MPIIAMTSPRIDCTDYSMDLWIEWKLKMDKYVATHPSHLKCKNSHKAFEITTITCIPLGDEYISDRIA
jgi:hypothetical protein